MDFGKGTYKEIREVIASEASGLSELTEAQDKVIRVFNKTDKEYQNLEIAASILHWLTGKDYIVGETYFDYGQGWRWTTILETSNKWGGVQVLTPRMQEDILFADDGQSLGKACDEVIRRG